MRLRSWQAFAATLLLLCSAAMAQAATVAATAVAASTADHVAGRTTTLPRPPAAMSPSFVDKSDAPPAPAEKAPSSRPYIPTSACLLLSALGIMGLLARRRGWS